MKDPQTAALCLPTNAEATDLIHGPRLKDAGGPWSVSYEGGQVCLRYAGRILFGGATGNMWFNDNASTRLADLMNSGKVTADERLALCELLGFTQQTSAEMQLLAARMVKALNAAGVKA